MSGMRYLIGAVFAGLVFSPGLGLGSATAADSNNAGTVSANDSDGIFGPDVAALLGRGQEQVFVALLRPLNTTTNGGPVRGIAVLRVDGDVLDVTTVARGLAPDIQHMQHIHGFVSGDLAACPPSAADTNKDGVVDVVEGVPFYGPILVPLDSDLNDLNPQTFPTASAKGVLRYEQSGSVSVIEKELGAPLDLERRVIALHGVAPNTPLPETTQTLPGLTPAFTLPVACGELVRVR